LPSSRSTTAEAEDSFRNKAQATAATAAETTHLAGSDFSKQQTTTAATTAVVPQLVQAHITTGATTGDRSRERRTTENSVANKIQKGRNRRKRVKKRREKTSHRKLETGGVNLFFSLRMVPDVCYGRIGGFDVCSVRALCYS
jgi:hypothetical protein